MIGTLRRMLSATLGRGPAAHPLTAPREESGEAERRIDAARRRLKASIPPPED